ncbi:MAG: DUF2798 domain-containing protein [Pseudomonadota bacterium]|nr:DUF2798 domain-containing protein [Pseudomonadota bacterium]
MIAKKYAPLVFSFFMALLMSGIMSLVISLFNLGLADGILLRWLQAWLFAFSVALPAIILVTPLVRRLAAAVVRD